MPRMNRSWVASTSQTSRASRSPERNAPARPGPALQPPPDRHPDLGQHPERDVVGGQPLQVAGHAAADAQRADRDHRHGDRDDAGVLRRPGQQEPGDGEQGDAAAGGGGARPPPRAAAWPRSGRASRSSRSSGRPPIPGRPAGAGRAVIGPAAMARRAPAWPGRGLREPAAVQGDDLAGAGRPPEPVGDQDDRAARPSGRAMTSPIAAAVAGSRWAVGSSSSSSGASRRNARASAICCRCPADSSARPLAERGVVAAGERLDERRRAGQPGGVRDRGPGGAGLAEGDVVGHRPGEQVRMLRHPGDLGAPGVRRGRRPGRFRRPRMVPAVGSVNRSSSRSSVLFPAPLGPVSTIQLARAGWSG